MGPHGEVRTRRWSAALPAVPTTLPGREGRARRLGYAALSVPLAAVYAALFAGLIAAVILALQVVGLFLFPLVLAVARAFGGLERRLARQMLGIEVENGMRLRGRTGGVGRRLVALLTASSTWRTMAWLGARVLFGVGVVATVLSGTGIAVVLFQYPGWAGFHRFWPLDIGLAAVVGILAVVVLRILDLQVRIIACIAPTLLGVSAQERIQALRLASLRLAARNSVARDLHDTIGHTLTASLLQATAARRTLTPNPAESEQPVDLAFARQALGHIEDNTRAALAELDRALAVLGDRGGATTAAISDLRAPDLTDIEGLVVGLRDCGLPLTLAVKVPPDEVRPPISQLAYRIIQEGTTNVLRHAGCPPTLVHVDRRDEELVVRVYNPYSARDEVRPGPGGGHGISGLRERAAALGGQLSAGAVGGGGFELLARLPLRGHA
jgi:signal transduction histidine kinase